MSEEKAQAIQSRTHEALTCRDHAFESALGFENAWRMAKALASSTLVPEIYRGPSGIPNCMIALEIAQRRGMSPFVVMQNMDVISGRPAWRSQFQIADVNASGRFSPLRFEFEDLGDIVFKNSTAESDSSPKIKNRSCVAWATERATGEIIRAPSATVELAVKEGWYHRRGSKWPNMTDLMLIYRAAAFFARIYCPERTLGLQTSDEVADFIEVQPHSRERVNDNTLDSSGYERLDNSLSAPPLARPRKRRQDASAEIAQTSVEPKGEISVEVKKEEEADAQQAFEMEQGQERSVGAFQ